MSSPARAAIILNHYLKQLFELHGLTWTKENQQDIIEMVRGLVAPARPTTPPVAPAARPVPPAAPETRRRHYDTVNIQRDTRAAVDSPATWLEE